MLNLDYGVKIDLRYSATGNGISNVVETVTISPDDSLTDGTAAGKADLEYSISGTLSGAVTFDLDALVGAIGTINFAYVKLIYIEVTDAANSLVVGGAATFPFAPWSSDPTVTETVQAGGQLFRVAPGSGWQVTGSAKNLKINKVSSNVAYRMVIVGTSV